MKPSVFFRLFGEAKSYDDEGLFIGERGWQDWMDEYDDDQLGDVLHKVWDLAHMSIKEMRESVTSSQMGACNMWGIKRRTLQNWEIGASEPADYTPHFFAYIVFCEGADNGHISAEN